MNKVIRYFVLFVIFFFVSHCSFYNNTGLWSGGEDEKRRISKLEKRQNQEIEKISLYSFDDEYLVEKSATKSIVLSKPKQNSSWVMSGLNYQNFFGNLYLSGIENIFLKKKIGKQKFSILRHTTSPLIYDNNIFFADDRGTIFSITQKGKINWKRNIYKKLYKKIYKKLSFSIYESKIYISDNIGFIYVINSVDGKIIWIKNHGVPLKSKIKIYKNKIFVINQDNRLICLDVDQGTLIWDIRSVSSFIKLQNFLGIAISKKGEVVTLNSSGDLMKINPDNGRIYWTVNTSNSMSAFETDFFKNSDLVISDDEIIFSTSSSLYSVNLSNGYLNWKIGMNSIGTPIIDNESIFLITENGFFINVERISGKINWSINVFKKFKEKHITRITGFIMGSGKIYAFTENGYLIVCSASTGDVEYSDKFIRDRITANPIISDGSLYILTENSRIIGFN